MGKIRNFLGAAAIGAALSFPTAYATQNYLLTTPPKAVKEYVQPLVGKQSKYGWAVKTGVALPLLAFAGTKLTARLKRGG